MAFIGAGEAADAPGAGSAADVLLLAVPDDDIGGCADALAEQGVRAGGVAFHCSGALGSEVLAPLAARGMHVASVHPVRSFADPARAAADFPARRAPSRARPKRARCCGRRSLRSAQRSS